MMKNMLKIAGLLILSALLFSCFTQRSTSKSGATKLVIKDTLSAKDSTKYELIIFDPEFDFWFSGREAMYKNQYSNEYLQTMNNLYVQEWNRMYSRGDRRIDCYIDYSISNNYDQELNFKLFMYFKYFEDTYRIKLVPGSGRIF